MDGSPLPEIYCEACTLCSSKMPKANPEGVGISLLEAPERLKRRNWCVPL